MKVNSITNLNEFIDAVIVISDTREEWSVKDFMLKINNIIVDSLRNGQMVSADVMIAYFNLHSVLKNKASRQRIRASALAVKSWVQDTKNDSYGKPQQRELLEN